MDSSGDGVIILKSLWLLCCFCNGIICETIVVVLGVPWSASVTSVPWISGTNETDFEWNCTGILD